MNIAERKGWRVIACVAAVALCASVSFAGKAAFTVSEGARRTGRRL